jgi:poly-beta-1,6-N-acetyl-D-glucosamine synthase
MIDDQISARSATYVLVTPVRNEEAFIGRTICSVLRQTILPLEWVIVSDGSTDKTDAIVKKAAQDNPWIRLIQLPERDQPSFAAVVENTTLGINSIKDIEYNYIGLLDSDLEFQIDYFEQLIEEFNKDSELGLAGGVAIDIGLSRDVLPRNKQEVPGALQFFRKECFKSIGGLIAIPEGGWDCLTCAMARMKGYKTRLVTQLIVDHLKPRNTIYGSPMTRKWQMGTRDYILGNHPLFELAKCSSRLLRERPILIASLVWFFGYTYSFISRKKSIVPENVVSFIRQEQLNRLTRLLKPNRNLYK